MVEVTFYVTIGGIKRIVTENECDMTLGEFLKNYGNNAYISIKRYSEEAQYDYVALPSWVQDEDGMAEFEDDVPDCLFKERWWDEVKEREVVHWNLIGAVFTKWNFVLKLGKEHKHG